MAGGIKHHLDFWREITNDAIIHSYVLGVKIDFNEEPIQIKIPEVINCNPIEADKISLEIVNYLRDGVIENAEHSDGEFISHIFTREKSKGGIRIILNLAPLNEFVVYKHFKMETFQNALTLIEPDCFMASVDLKSAYYSVPIDPKFRKYLRFYWNGNYYQYTCLPNGLSSAPRIFTKLLKPIFSFLRAKGYISVYYLDDSLLLSNNYETCVKNVDETITNLKKAGFILNYEKSSLLPAKEIKFLGLVINSEKMEVTLPVEKRNKIVELGDSLLREDFPVIRSLACFIGTVIAAFPAVKYGQLFYREMEKCKINALSQQKGNFDRRVKINEAAKNEIRWWIENSRYCVNPIQQPKMDHIIDTDASLLGWGAIFNDQKTGGRWSAEESRMHINVLELEAIKFAIKSFFCKESNIHVRIRCDNTTAVSYINKMGGIQSDNCNSVAKELWSYCRLKNIWISAEHLPGVENVEADKESRKFNDDIEWSLENIYFDCIIREFGDFDIDLFACRLNAKIDNYVSWRPDPNALFVDAFYHSWNLFKFYAFPPFSQISACLEKIWKENSEGVIVIPLWRGQIWFPKLLKMLVAPPLILPLDVVYLPHKDSRHPLRDKLRLVACLVSGNFMKTEEFHQVQCQSLCHHGGKVPQLNMKFTLENGIFSVLRGKLIPCVIQKNL